MDAVEIVQSNQLDKTSVKNALPYLMFLKRKRLGKVKSRGCANGRPQREFISQEETRSPTVSTYGLMASCCIDFIGGGQTVYTCNIPGAFLQSVWPKKEQPTYLKFEGKMVDLICEVHLSVNSYLER